MPVTGPCLTGREGGCLTVRCAKEWPVRLHECALSGWIVGCYIRGGQAVGRVRDWCTYIVCTVVSTPNSVAHAQKGMFQRQMLTGEGVTRYVLRPEEFCVDK